MMPRLCIIHRILSFVDNPRNVNSTTETPRRPLLQDTLVTRGGRLQAAKSGLVNTPVHRASTIVFESMAELDAAKAKRFSKGQMFYGRFGTPDVFAFEEAVAELERGYGAVAVQSGLAACVLPLVAFLKPGDHVLVTDSVYEPVRTALHDFIARSGVEVGYYDPRVGAGIASLLRSNTRIVYTETPGSLTFEMQDLPAIAHAAHAHGAIVVCDNTWASPLFHQPIVHGADIVVHAGTKYIVGHSDAMLGVVVSTEKHYEPLRRAGNWLGYHASPDDVYLAARGLRTLAVRMRQHDANARHLAAYLEQRPEVARVLHPALESHEGHAIWKRDFNGAAGLFSVVLRTESVEAACAFVDSLELFGIGFSWGGFESLALVSDPAHCRTATPWKEKGVLVRFHAGLESVEDLQADLARGLDLLSRR